MDRWYHPKRNLIFYILSEIALLFYFPIAHEHFRQFERSYYVYGLILLFILTSFFACLLIYTLSKMIEKTAQQEAQNTLLRLEKDHLLATLKAEQDLEQLKEKLKVIVENQTEEHFDSRATVQELIQKESNTIFINYCSNPIIDAILYHKVLRIKENHIDYSINVQVPEVLEIESYTLLSILTNMIDNAIEAVEKSASQKTIDISLTMKANFLKCQITNSLETMPEMNGHTSKADKENHGFGLQILEATCKKYDGSYRMQIQNNTCISTALLKNEKGD